jgi:hypothetical protein
MHIKALHDMPDEMGMSSSCTSVWLLFCAGYSIYALSVPRFSAVITFDVCAAR